MWTLRIWLACMRGVKHSWRELSGAKRDTTSMMSQAPAALIAKVNIFDLFPCCRPLKVYLQQSPKGLLQADSLLPKCLVLLSQVRLLKANRPDCPMNLERYTILHAKEYMCYKHGSSKVNLKTFKRAYKEIDCVCFTPWLQYQESLFSIFSQIHLKISWAYGHAEASCSE